MRKQFYSAVIIGLLVCSVGGVSKTRIILEGDEIEYDNKTKTITAKENVLMRIFSVNIRTNLSKFNIKKLQVRIPEEFEISREGFNLKGLKRFEEYILLVEKYDALVFDYSDPPEKFKNLNYKFQLYKEYEYTKGDVFRYFNIDNKSNIYNSPQIWAGSFFLKKCKLSMDILKTWGEACKKIELLDNSESLTKNHSDFKGMRGSQGIFSIICKLKSSNSKVITGTKS